MYRIEASIVGEAPILFNRRVTDPDEPAGHKKSLDEKAAEAAERVYRDEHGLYWPAWNLKRAILDGCRAAGIKNGKASMVPTLQAAIFPEREPRFGVNTFDAIHETLGRVPPRTGSQVTVRRPMLDRGWVLTFGIQVVLDPVRHETIRTSLETAGLLVGIGSWRPDYGRFTVRDWKVTK